MQIHDKVAIVTDASAGIGLATAKLLTTHGARVALLARSADRLNQLTKELPGSAAFPTDLTDLPAVRAAVKKAHQHLGRIDILVNNAGQGYDSTIEGTEPAVFRQVFELDVMGPLVAMQAVIPIMRQQGGGAIVNVSSGTSLMALPNMGAYAAAKRALNGLSLTARAELEPDQIVVSLVYPFITSTDFERNTIKQPGLPEWDSDGGGRDIPPADLPEYVAEKILAAIETGAGEIFAHDWMSRRTENH